MMMMIKVLVRITSQFDFINACPTLKKYVLLDSGKKIGLKQMVEEYDVSIFNS
jgi:hypothetical protein